MLRRCALTVVCITLAAGCSKKLPEIARAVPADADILATLDVRKTLADARQAVKRALPAGDQGKVLAVEMLVKKAVELTGIDPEKLGRAIYIGWLGSREQMAFIAEGIDAKSLKGLKQGAHRGVDIYAAEMVRYAQLPGLGTLAAPTEAVLKKVLDAHSGQAKRIGDTDRAKVLEKLLDVEKDLDQLRMYLLTGEIPGGMPSPYKLKGGGFFLHLDRGATGALVAERKDAQDLKSKIDTGMLFVQMALAAGGKGLGLPVELDPAAQKSIVDLLKNIKTGQQGEIVTVGYRGDLKPLIDQAIALVYREYDREISEPPPPAPDASKK